MSEKVGEIFYNVTLETSGMIEGQRKVQKEVNATGSSLDGLTGKLSKVASAVSVLAVAMATLKSANLADEMRMLGAKIEVAAGSMEAGASAMAQLEQISKRTSTSVAANAEVFTRLNQSILQMGGTQNDTLNITELLGKAIRVSGASAVEAKSAMLQFGQALGSGKLAGDELRSLMENAPYLMRQLADGIGVPVGALKDLGEQGKLTADVVTNALSKASAQIDADFQKFPQTIASAMDVAMDAAGRANSKLDELTGTSVALTGVTKGMGDVLDILAKQFGAANEEAGSLGRNSQITTWADRTRTVLSYVADAADVVVRTFKVVGYTLAGLAAGAVQIASGNFRGASEAFSASWADSVKTVDAQLSGLQMRQAWAMGNGGGRGTVNPQAAASVLKAPTAKGGKPAKAAKATKSADERFDDEKYLAGLKKNTVDGWAAINAAEAEAVRNSDKLLADKKISRETHEKALTLIAQAAVKDRQELMEKEYSDGIDEMSRTNKAKEAAAKEAAALEQKKKDEIFSMTKAVNPIDALRQEYEAKLQIVTAYEERMAQAGVDATTQGQIARTQIEGEYQLQRTALAEQAFRSQGEANAFLVDTINSFSAAATSSIVGLIDGTATATDVMRTLASVVLNEAVSSLVQIGVQQVKNALFSKTVDAANAAAAAAKGGVYAASVAAQVTGMSAMAAQNAFAATAAIPIVGPGLAPAAALAAGAAAMALGSPAIATAPIAGARQYGGPVNSGGLYRVNEKGGAEMFTAGNGSQYMLAGSSGKVTAADKVGGGNTAPTVIIQNTGTGQAVQSQSYDQQTNTLKLVMADLANQFSSNSGQVWSALRSGSNVQGRM